MLLRVFNQFDEIKFYVLLNISINLSCSLVVRCKHLRHMFNIRTLSNLRCINMQQRYEKEVPIWMCMVYRLICCVGWNIYYSYSFIFNFPKKKKKNVPQNPHFMAVILFGLNQFYDLSIRWVWMSTFGSIGFGVMALNERIS